MEDEKINLIKIKEEAVTNAIQAQAAGFHISVQKQLDIERKELEKLFSDEYSSKLAIMEHAHVHQLVTLSDEIEKVKTQVNSFDNVINIVNSNQLESRQLHTQTATLLGLQDVLTTSNPLNNVVLTLKRVCKDNELITQLLNTLSNKSLTNGVSTIPDLRARFKVVRKEVRKASLIPDFAPNFLGQAVGSVLASISWSPSENSKIDPKDITSNDVEDRLAAIAYYLEINDLNNALNECNNINGYPKTLMNDWEEAVKERLVADQIVKIIKSELSLKHLNASKI